MGLTMIKMKMMVRMMVKKMVKMILLDKKKPIMRTTARMRRMISSISWERGRAG
jgi:hypothetical protein